MDWFAICTRPQRELAAVDALEAYGLDVFCPVQHRWSRPRLGSKRKRAPIPYPMLRGYIFAQFASAMLIPWNVLRAERSTVRAVLALDGVPRALPAVQVEALRTLSETAQPYNWAVDTHGAMLPVPGQMVEIVSGPYAGHVTRVDEVTLSRVKALLELLGGPRLVSLPVEHVRAVA